MASEHFELSPSPRRDTDMRMRVVRETAQTQDVPVVHGRKLEVQFVSHFSIHLDGKPLKAHVKSWLRRAFGL